jgi:hypothetical protein
MFRAAYAQASDEALITQSVEEPEAFTVFYDRFERQVLAFFYRASASAGRLTSSALRSHSPRASVSSCA